jgi:hypothetical protein
MSYIVEALFKWENYTSGNNALPHLQGHWLLFASGEFKDKQ